MTRTQRRATLGVQPGLPSGACSAKTGGLWVREGTSVLLAGRLLSAVAVPAVLAACSTLGPTPIVDGSAPSARPALEYSVRVDPDNPRRLSARLDLSRETTPNRTAFVRGMTFGLASQVISPACDGVELMENGVGQWIVPDPCSDLSWSIEVEEAMPNGVDSSLQKSLYFSDMRWWLFSEPTSLLRLSSAKGGELPSLRIEGLASSDSIAGATQLEDGSWRLPPISSAPEFFAFGKLSLQRHNLERMHTTYVVDDLDRFQRLPLLDMHERVLGYLADVFQVPPTLSDGDRHLLVVWLGIDDEENLALNAARTMLVVAHEQTHQLHDLMWGGGPPVPTWVGESLAHYYGLMALARSGLPADVVARPMDAFIDADRPVQVGLVEYNRRYAAGDQDAYGMFYAQGATFWAEADRILRSASPAQRGLDALMPEFLRSADSAGDGLPESFRQLLVGHGGAEMSELIERFVGE
jgi:hypothetical protein